MKTSLFKKILIVLVVISTSCGDKLDIKPTGAVDATSAAKNVDLLVLGAYAFIGSGPGVTGPGIQEGALYSTDLLLDADLLASENYINWAGTFQQYRQVSQKQMNATNTTAVRMWAKAFSAINQANTILANLDNAPEEDRDRFKGHALFIRGIVEFDILRLFQDPVQNLGIPLMTTVTASYEDITLPARASIADSYTAILSDLEEAKSLLPESDGELANTYVASAFLARVYLTLGNYGKALTEANNVIENGPFELSGSVEDAFNTSGSKESVFEIQQTTQNNAGTANDGLTTFYSCDTNTPGSAARGDIQITDEFQAQYTDPNDKRLTILIYTGDCSKANTTSGKWRNPYANIPLIRLSEMYLVRAECNVRLESEIGATPKEDINAIRAKADASLFDPDDDAVVVTLDDVLLERDLELAFEGQRVHDYRRTGRTVSVGGKTIDYSAPQFFFPIPQVELNSNPNMKQNTFYK